MSELVGPPASWSARTDVDGRVYLFVPDSEAFLALNETATIVWRHCDGTMTPDDLVAELVSTYGGDRAEVQEVVRTALQLLTSVGLLPPPARPA